MIDGRKLVALGKAGERIIRRLGQRDGLCRRIGELGQQRMRLRQRFGRTAGFRHDQCARGFRVEIGDQALEGEGIDVFRHDQARLAFDAQPCTRIGKGGEGTGT